MSKIIGELKNSFDSVGVAFIKGIKEGLGVNEKALELSPEDFYNDPKLLYKLDIKTATLVDFSMGRLYPDWNERKSEFKIKIKKRGC